MAVSKLKQYHKLIKKAHASYSNNPILWWPDEFQNEINYWSYFQGANCLDASIMLVGQDFGAVKAIDIENMLAKSKAIDEGKSMNYLDEVDVVAPTDINLCSLFQHAFNIDIHHLRHKELFFTNIVLGYRKTTCSGFLPNKCFEKDLPFFEMLVGIIKPKIIICLGRKTFEYALKALHAPKPKYNKYNELIASRNNCINVCRDDYSTVVCGVAHCGSMETINRCQEVKSKDKGIELQKGDWKYIADNFYF